MHLYVYNVALIKHEPGCIKTTGTVGYVIATNETVAKGYAYENATPMYPGFEVEDIRVVKVKEDDLYLAYQYMLKNADNQQEEG